MQIMRPDVCLRLDDFSGEFAAVQPANEDFAQ
jgi:hypothetical protein